MNALRIRDNGKVRELNIPKDKLEVLEKIVSSNTIMDQTKHATIRKLTEGSPCCICDGIPAFEINFPFHGGGATKIERYCDKCIKNVFAREAVL
ncbi:MAG: hypothetical protein WB975_10900 [Nitrososphaeraceae archaeon]